MKTPLRRLAGLACALALAFAPVLTEASETSAAAQDRIIRIGLFDTFEPEFWPHTLGPTLEILRERNPGLKIEVEELPVGNTVALKERELSFFVSSAVRYWAAHLDYGASAVAVRTPEYTTDPTKSIAGLIVTRADDDRIRGIRDLRNRTVAVAATAQTSEYLAFLGLLRKAGLEEKSLAEVKPAGWRHPGVASALLAGSVDAGILRLCELERLEREGVIPAGALRAIDAGTDPVSGCRHSTPLYPGIVLASMPGTSSAIVTSFASTLYTMPAVNGQKWFLGSDFTEADELSRTLALGSYAWLQEWSVPALWRRFSTEILLAGALLLALLWHIARVNRLVYTRTASLREAIDTMRELDRAAKESRAELSALERAGVIHQLSGLIAHELKQPLGAIANYCTGLRFHLKNAGKPDVPLIESVLDKIEGQAVSASETINFVRRYAKQSGDMPAAHSDLAQVIRRAVATYRSASLEACGILVGELPPEAPASIDPKGAELCVYNVLKNAAEASRRTTDARGPMVEIRLEPPAEGASLWSIVVSDNGPGADDETLEKLGRPMMSLKESGLGLGLMVVRNILEQNGGRIDFSRSPAGGLAVRLMIPGKTSNA